MKDTILPHVPEIGGDEDDFPRALSAQRVGGQQDFDEFLVRPVERTEEEDAIRAVARDAHQRFAVGKTMDLDVARLQAESFGDRSSEAGGVSKGEERGGRGHRRSD